MSFLWELELYIWRPWNGKELVCLKVRKEFGVTVMKEAEEVCLLGVGCKVEAEHMGTMDMAMCSSKPLMRPCDFTCKISTVSCDYFLPWALILMLNSLKKKVELVFIGCFHLEDWVKSIPLSVCAALALLMSS